MGENKEKVIKEDEERVKRQPKSNSKLQLFDIVCSEL